GRRDLCTRHADAAGTARARPGRAAVPGAGAIAGAGRRRRPVRHGRLTGRAKAPGWRARGPGAPPLHRGSGRLPATDSRRWHGRRRPARGGWIGAARGGLVETGSTTGWPRRGPVAAAPARARLNTETARVDSTLASEPGRKARAGRRTPCA